jgi:bla regulator protein BlaR1
MDSLANHLWQSTLFAAAAGLLAFVLVRHRAEIRYRLWMLASIKFLVPFSLLTSLGSRIEWRSMPAVAPAVPAAIGQIGQTFSPVAAQAASPADATWVWLLLVWALGSGFLAVRWWILWQRIQASIRTASRLPAGGPVRVVSSAVQREPGVFGILRPVLVLPQGIVDRLTPAQFQAVLAHEFCHVRRRDNLVTALHMVVEAVFWFHPLVWWVGARLAAERERSCDEEVLRRGSSPAVYASAILSVCRFYLESPLACVAGVTGGDLKRRIATIMTARTAVRLRPWHKLLLAAAGIAALAGPVLVGMQAENGLKFEVATIKPSKGGGGGRGGLEILPGGGLHMAGTTVKQLIAFAYGVTEAEISGGPAWISSSTYDILGKPERPDSEANPAPGTAGWTRLQQRLQSLLAERCRLAVHTESKPAPGYALVVAKSGPKLEPTKSGPDMPPGTMRSVNQINGRAGTMPMLATVLSEWLRRPVEDRTGLTGRYDYKLEYAPETAGDAPAEPGPSVFSALQEQLGLKLESIRGTVKTIVIDRIDKPSAN